MLQLRLMFPALAFSAPLPGQPLRQWSGEPAYSVATWLGDSGNLVLEAPALGLLGTLMPYLLRSGGGVMQLHFPS